MPRVEPQLKPYHPNHKMKVPSTIKGKLWGPNSSGVWKRPLRGPAMAAPTKAPTPPVMCTTPEPAKSMKPTEVTEANHP